MLKIVKFKVQYLTIIESYKSLLMQIVLMKTFLMKIIREKRIRELTRGIAARMILSYIQV